MTRLRIIYCFATQLSLAYSSPTVEEELSAAAGNLTALKSGIASSWVVGPQFRGTSDILWSCIVTLIACIYTAIHLNVPPAHEGNWHFIWRKAKWVALALFAPELVLFCAYRQFSEARKLVKELNELRGAHAGANGVRVKTQEVSKEPTDGAGHTLENSQPSTVNVEMGVVRLASCAFKTIPNSHRTIGTAHIRGFL